MALLILRPYVSQLTRAAGDLRDVLNRSGEMVDLVSQIAALTEMTADLRAVQELAQSAKGQPASMVATADLERLWKQLEKQWQDTRDSFRAVAQAQGVLVSFQGIIGVREAAKTLVTNGAISESTANAMVDLSTQYQYMFRTTTNRAECLNENVVAAYTKTATQVRQALKAGL